MTDIKFEKARACYDQNFEQFRSLNQQLIRIPQVSVTVTGGIWFVVGSAQTLSETVAFVFLLFTWIVNLGLGASCFRIRDVMESYAEKIEQFSPENFVSGTPRKPTFRLSQKYSMIRIYVFLMFIAGLASGLIAVLSYFPISESCIYGPTLRWMALLSCLTISGYAFFEFFLNTNTKMSQK
ncbi:hypothetical protein [Roseibium polysiphoniae]|uniref:Uncharacterized protein n=1 Tax=Roseibium polysiphoniae TaxID=2571221 RepID=A0ABR9C7Z4_9HYPH|nr:hypothetical protein [Roseibium polysiphoniae]MBD8876027.1 hypothetical protein [Roseibium polysiphoniae]